MKRIIDLTAAQACDFFLKEESYFNFDLPQYFVFQSMLKKVSTALNGKQLPQLYSTYIDPNNGKQKTIYPYNCENVNYKLLNNKDGKFAWRPLQLIHPVLYVSLVHKITEQTNWRLIVERFKIFSSNPNIECHSIPFESTSKLSDKATSVKLWWHSIEQKSIELALNFEYVIHTDISDCYGSIYTHSITWALHSKAIGKEKRFDNTLIGNCIDEHLRDMSFGQTNGIPQGSVLMDFIAEMILGYADLLLSEKITEQKITDYKIIRYRDDYRVFSNNPQQADHIIKLLTEILIDLGMRLNGQKTLVSANVVRDSIKPDKLFWILEKREIKNLQQYFLIIHDLSQKFPNSGSLNKALTNFFDRIKNIKETNQYTQVLISILVDIAFKNPRTYPIAAAILSKLLSLIDDAKLKEKILELIIIRFSKIPNTGHIKLWLQRVTLKIDRHRKYEEKLCEKVNNKLIVLWNSDWLNHRYQELITSEPIIDESIIDKIDKVIGSEEVEFFNSKTEYEESLSDNFFEIFENTVSS